MPQIQLNRVGLTFQPATGSLVLDDDNDGRIEFRDEKGVKTALAVSGTSEDSKKLVKATWAEAGRDASLQLFMAGFQEEEAFDEDDDNGEDAENKNEGKESNAADGEDSSKSGKGKKDDGEKVIPKFHRVHGLSAQDQSKVREFLQNAFSIGLDVESWDSRGGNFGNMAVSKLKRCVLMTNFEDEDKSTMEIPLANVSQIAVPGKNEIEIQYTFPAGSAKDANSGKFELSVVRLFVPQREEDESKEDTEAAMEDWRRKMKAVADMHDEVDEAALGLVCNIDEQWCNFAAPRGKYRVDVYKDFFRMRGKTYDFKIPYSTIVQMHLLDHPEIVAKFLVISLSTPLRQGQQRYPHLVMTIDDQESELKLLLSSEELAEKYPDSSLQQTMKGNMPEVIAKLLKTVSQKKVFVTPSTGFTAMKEDGQDEAAKRDRCVRCSYKANSGFLFPMKQSMIFLHKPVLYFRYDAIAHVEFKRMDTKTFDFEVTLSDAPDSGSGLARTMEFGQIPRKQLEGLRKFMKNDAKLTIKHEKDLDEMIARNTMTGGGRTKGGQTIFDLGGDDDEEDEEDSDFDADAVKKKKKSKEGGEDDAKGEGEDEDEDEDDDESSGGSGSSSEDDSEESDMAEEVSMDEDEVAALTGAGGNVQEGKRKRSSGEKQKKKKAKGTDDQEEGEGSKKKKKDPNAPKQGKTAFFFFVERVRPELKAKGITSVTEIGKQAGEMWRALEDKSEYERLAVQDKERYRKEMETYKPPAGMGGDSPMKKKKDPNAPKAARSAFTYYGEEQHALLKAEGVTAFGDRSKKIAETWKALSDADKTKYNDLAAKDRERHTEEMKNYKPPAGMEEPKKKKSQPKKKKAAEGASGPDSEGPKKKKAKAIGGGELPSSDSSSSDDSSSEDE